MRKARQLKYQSPESDLKALEEELALARSSDADQDEGEEYRDPWDNDYSDYADRWAEEDE